MPTQLPKRRLTLIDQIIKAAKGHAERMPLDLLRRYFSGVGEEDLAAREAAYLAGIAGLHFGMAEKRRTDQTLLKIVHVSDSSSLVLIATDDRPFLVESLGIAFAETGVAVRMLVHPVLHVRRDGRGRLLSTHDDAHERARTESWQLYEIDRLWDAESTERLEARLHVALEHVQLAVTDWMTMRAKVRRAIEQLAKAPLRGERAQQRDEAIALLDWMEGAHFVFLGYRYQRLTRGAHRDRLQADQRSGLGILRAGSLEKSGTENLQGELRDAMRSTDPLIITKSALRSTVHRSGHLDHLTIKDFDKQGRVQGEHRFLGLWTATAYFASPNDIPVVRRKVSEVITRFGLDPRSHDGKAVLAVLETWPRDELFQSTPTELVDFVRGVVNLYDRPTTRVMLRHDPLGRFWSCMAFVPRDRYTTEVRHRIEALLTRHCGGSDLESQVQIALSNHARLHVMIRGGVEKLSGIQVAALEREVADAVATWTDHLRATLQDALAPAAAARLFQRYAPCFPLAYQTAVSPSTSLRDINAMEHLASSNATTHWRVHRPEGDAGIIEPHLHLRLVRRGSSLPIADLVPMFENFGLRLLGEQSWIVGDASSQKNAIQDFDIELKADAKFDVDVDGDRLLEGLQSVRDGLIDNDGFNRLLLSTPLDIHQINVLRACCRYLLQAGIPFSQRYMERTLESNTAVAHDLYQLFAVRHDPKLRKETREKTEAQVLTRLAKRLDGIVNADEDRILRRFQAVVLAILRCNFFQRSENGEHRPVLAFKLDPKGIPDLPLPRPRYEIYVVGPRVEGVHLRMGEVARGGLRWSDRREDFRTEVLGLMKAQNVKNTVIVPVGAKGGFVARQLPSGPRDAIHTEGVAAYRQYINALLDLTDNIVAGRVAPPPNLHRRDGNDPYLVVAADKGTATFSDIANAIAVERGFWLGDAFASGGSAGYDHKKMGITARGAWECVKRHFRELGRDIQREPFTVAGIGDMSGDVFGNGMLLSQQIKLVAAFNHQHIFIDPNPNPATSFAERVRLFALPRSAWTDYNARLISKGGGIYERSAKAIPLSVEVRSMLGIDATSATPNDVIRAILCMSVDLLWNGGIGTYVKASDEPQSAAGDRSNDAVRVDGRDLRAKVVGEGGNLGCTQRGRVEYALTGGRINTDFIDNSAGVNTSDVEVNLKILTSAIESRGALRRAERDRLLARLTGDVTKLVLRNNYLQSQALSTLELQSAARLPELQSLIRHLERKGELDRQVENLPDDEALATRRKQGLGLTRPELAVVLAYSKISLYRQLIDTNLPDDSYFAQEVERYFPSAVTQRFSKDIRRHQLRREIVTTAVTNSLVNRMGPSFVMRACEETSASAADVARAYSIARELLQARDIWSDIEALDNRIPSEAQYAAYADTARTLRHATMWLLRRQSALVVADTVSELSAPVRTFQQIVQRSLSGDLKREFVSTEQRYLDAGLPATLATRLANGTSRDAAFDVAELAKLQRRPIVAVAADWFAIGEKLKLDWLGSRIDRLVVDGPLQAIARSGLREAVRKLQRAIVTAAATQDYNRWSASRREALARWERTLADVSAGGSSDFAALSVCVDSLRSLTD
jgi:glutamate dehydrogenase